MAGQFDTAKFVYINDLRLPEFSYTCKVSKVKAFIFDSPACKYNIIFGRSFLNQVKIDVLSSKMKCVWINNKIPFHLLDYFRDKPSIHKVLQVDPVWVQHAESHVVEIKSSFQDIKELCNQQKHLTKQQQNKLYEVLMQHQKLFDGSLGCYPK